MQLFDKNQKTKKSCRLCVIVLKYPTVDCAHMSTFRTLQLLSDSKAAVLKYYPPKLVIATYFYFRQRHEHFHTREGIKF